jgi:hypothetical protein
MLHPVRDRREWVERKRALTDERPGFVLPVHDVRRRGPLPEPDTAGLSDGSQVGRERRRLARMLADELVNPPVPHVPGHDLLSARSISLPVSRLASVENAMRQSVVLPLQTPGSVVVAATDRRNVMLVHGDTYSIVWGMDGEPSPVLVLVDELPGYAVRVDEDTSQRGRIIIMEMTMGLMINLQAASAGAGA